LDSFVPDEDMISKRKKKFVNPFYDDFMTIFDRSRMDS